jgi:hypothetical protein
MANRSTFPLQIDTFVEHFDITSADLPSVKRFQELKLKAVRTLAEDTELAQLTQSLRNKIISPEDFNKFQDALVNMETFIKDNVEGYIAQKQGEFTTFINTSKTDVNTHATNQKNIITQTKDEFVTLVNTKTTEVTNYTNTKVNEMTEKRDYFVSFVNTKQDEVRKLVQEFDSNSSRYYQRWTATQGQKVFNIYYGGDVTNIPADAKLNIDAINIDIVANGTTLTPNVDYRVVPDGSFDKIEILGSNNVIDAGTEIIAKWYKNVGKLYFSHASSHGEGGTDPLNITRGMLDSTIRPSLPVVSSTAPTSPLKNQIWIDIS